MSQLLLLLWHYWFSFSYSHISSCGTKKKANLEVTGEEKPKTRLRRRKANKRLCRKKRSVYALPDEEKPVCAVPGRKIPTADISR